MSAGISGTAAAIAGSAVLGGIISSQGAQSAAQTQAAAQNQASSNSLAATQQSIAAQQKMYNQNLANQAPYMQAGSAALAQLQAGMGSDGTNGSLTQAFTRSDLNSQLAPNYQFQLGQGLQALQASAAANGTLMSGQGLKNINDYAQNQASGSYQQAYNNYVTNQTNQYNRLGGLVSAGQNAAAGVGNAGVQTGTNIANTNMSGVAAANAYSTGAAGSMASGQLGTANAITGSLNNGANSLLKMQYYNNMAGYGMPGMSSPAIFGPSGGFDAYGSLGLSSLGAPASAGLPGTPQVNWNPSY